MMTDAAQGREVERNPYALLRERLEREGLFKKRPWFYLAMGALLTAGLCASAWFMTMSTSWILQTLNAVFLGIVFMQFGFLGHDIAHHQVFSSRVKDQWIGSLVYALAIGVSLDHWYGGHDKHHKYTNQIGNDPDIALPLVFTKEQFELRGQAYKKYVLPHQHWYFFFFMPLAYLNYIITGLPWNVRKLMRPIRIYELLLIAIHFLALFYVVFSSLGIWIGIYFLAVNAIVTGAYAGFSFAPNHKGEDVLTPDEQVTYKTQITSTRNIKPNWLVDLAVGGLNYQIEHHLFSFMPRPNLKKARVFVKQFCQEENIPYHETSFSGSVVEMYTALRQFARARG